MPVIWNLVLTIFVLCAQMTFGTSIVDTEVQIIRTPGSFVLKDRSTTKDINLPVLPGHTWSADFKNIYQGSPYSIRWIVNNNYLARDGASIKMTVSPNDIGSTLFIEAHDWNQDWVRGPRIHLVMAPAPNLTSELPKSVNVFPGEYVDLTVETSIDDGLTMYIWDIEMVPLPLQTTRNVRVRANEDLHGAKLTVSVINSAGKVTSSTIINVLLPRWAIALIVSGVFMLLCGLVIGVLYALHSLGYVNIKLRKRDNNTTKFARVGTEMQEGNDLNLATETN
jgi:hypothetical protein